MAKRETKRMNIYVFLIVMVVRAKRTITKRANQHHHPLVYPYQSLALPQSSCQFYPVINPIHHQPPTPSTPSTPQLPLTTLGTHPPLGTHLRRLLPLPLALLPLWITFQPISLLSPQSNHTITCIPIILFSHLHKSLSISPHLPLPIPLPPIFMMVVMVGKMMIMTMMIAVVFR